MKINRTIATTGLLAAAFAGAVYLMTRDQQPRTAQECIDDMKFSGKEAKTMQEAIHMADELGACLKRTEKKPFTRFLSR